MNSYTEADEACKGDVSRALLNLRHQVAMDETAGVIDMYAEAAYKCGATHQQVSNHRAR